MALVAALLFFALVGVTVALAGGGLYYVRVVRPQLDAAASEPTPTATQDRDSLATFVEQLQELARLRDQGILTSREFTTKKSELLERI
jgi:cytochrome c-type biogenesis protein CcmH/NrfG